MRFSILINNYNYGSFIARAIDSALNQTYPNIEVIVVDDGSTDQSRQIISSYGDSLTPIFKDNGGQASCINMGFEASTGDVVCLLDSDDRFFPEKISELTDLYSSRTDVGWIFHSMIYEDEEERVIGDAIVKPSGYVDLRRRMRLGYLGYILPATSALTFRRQIMRSLLPMSEASGVTMGDHYLKLGAAALSVGLLLDKPLSAQKIHEKNEYTRKKNDQKKAIMTIQTAIALKAQLPISEAFCDNLVGTAQSLTDRNTASPAQGLIERYLKDASLIGRLRVALWRTIKKIRTRRN